MVESLLAFAKSVKVSGCRVIYPRKFIFLCGGPQGDLQVAENEMETPSQAWPAPGIRPSALAALALSLLMPAERGSPTPRWAAKASATSSRVSSRRAGFQTMGTALSCWGLREYDCQTGVSRGLREPGYRPSGRRNCRVCPHLASVGTQTSPDRRARTAGNEVGN